MKKIVLFDPSYGTSNLGDFIINEAVMREMNFLFDRHYLVRYSTHNPIMHLHQLLRRHNNTINCSPDNLKFLGGSNIFKQNLLKYTLDWNINIFTKGLYRNSVTIGGGSEGNPKTINRYTRNIYKTVLAKNYIHSVRDNKTKGFLETMGFSAINTGCPTLWGLDEEHCSQINTRKSKDVVFTLTANKNDLHSDQKLIDILVENYEKVYFWVQGTEDKVYFDKLKNTSSIQVINPSLEAYRQLLKTGDVDYVGTRLHAGIFAMQHKVRAIVLIVDNRARDMHEDFNVNAIDRDNMEQLEIMINSEFTTSIKIDKKKIEEWKNQFTNY